MHLPTAEPCNTICASLDQHIATSTLTVHLIVCGIACLSGLLAFLERNISGSLRNFWAFAGECESLVNFWEGSTGGNFSSCKLLFLLMS
jgi:hypothetical protein